LKATDPVDDSSHFHIDLSSSRFPQLNRLFTQRYGVAIAFRGGLANETALSLQAAEIPAVMRQIPTQGSTPPPVYLVPRNTNENVEPQVVIQFFGGFGSWGISIGSPDKRAEESSRCYEWIPGVYITISP